MLHVVSTQHHVDGFGEVHFHRCAKCNSLNVSSDSRFIDYDDSDGVAIDSAFNDFYLEVGAGIDFLARLLERCGMPKGGTLLDVGCGFGHTLDYWTWATGGQAVGLEPSSYGAAGRAMLGVDIRPQYLDAATDLHGRLFDCVISSEVIEHVTDPAGFLRGLRPLVAPSGAIALTTPDAGFITPDSPDSMVLAALSPGLHRTLFSAGALRQLLAEAGFPNAEVRSETERLVAFAAPAPRAFAADPPAERRRYIRYLRDRAGNAAPRDAMGRGLAYRCFKELVNEGEITTATSYGLQLAEALRRDYGFDPLDAAAVRAVVADISDWHEYGRRASFLLPCFAFYAAMAARQGAQGFGLAGRGFELAADITAHALTINPLFFQEAASLHWPARFEAALVARDEGDHVTAQAGLEAIVAGPPPSGSHRFATLLPALRARAQLQLGVLHLHAGAVHEARTQLDMLSSVSGLLPPGEQDLLHRVSAELAALREHQVEPSPNQSSQLSGAVVQEQRGTTVILGAVRRRVRSLLRRLSR